MIIEHINVSSIFQQVKNDILKTKKNNAKKGDEISTNFVVVTAVSVEFRLVTGRKNGKMFSTSRKRTDHDLLKCVFSLLPPGF